MTRDTLNELTDRKIRQQHQTEQDGSLESAVLGRAQLAAEAFVELCRNRQPVGDTPVIDMTLVVTAPDTDQAETTDGIIIDGETFNMCACDPILRFVTLDKHGHPLNIGRAKRLATDTQRRAARIRDGGCAFPGCDRPVNWTELHHIKHWRHGGTTDINNLICLCRHHHGIVHTTGWTTTHHTDGTLTFHSPTGKTLTTKPRSPANANASP